MGLYCRVDSVINFTIPSCTASCGVVGNDLPSPRSNKALSNASHQCIYSPLHCSGHAGHRGEALLIFVGDLVLVLTDLRH